MRTLVTTSVLAVLLAVPPALHARLTCGTLCGDAMAECRSTCSPTPRGANRRCRAACRDRLVDACKRQLGARAACLPPDAWPMLARDASSNYENLAEHTLSPTNAAGLKLDWRFPARGLVNGAAAVVDGTAFVLSSAGLYALDPATRTIRWERPDVRGSSSPTWHDGTLYVHMTNTNLVALDPATGAERWRTVVDARGIGWSSPVVFEDLVIVGVAGADYAAYFDFVGGVVALDRHTGAVRWRFDTAAPPNNGVSVWSTPSVDPDLRLVIGSTGNNFSGDAGPTSDAVFALDADTGALRWMTQLTPDDVFSIGGALGPDADFGTNPILFETTIHGRRRKLVAAGQKSGAMWALDRKTGAVVWGTPLGPGSSLPGGILNNGAFDGERLLVAASDGTSSAPGGEETRPPNQGHSRLAALDPATGAIVWERQIGGWVWAPITVANGVGFVAADTTFEAFDTATGAALFHFPASGTITSAPVVVGGRVYFGAGMSYFVGVIARDFYVLALDGRGGGGGGGGSTGGNGFSAIYDDIVVASGCTTAGCHGSTNGAGRLRMTSRDEAYANLVGVAAAGGACGPTGLLRVAPGDPDQSLLYLKVARTPPCGGPMPPAAPITADALARIRAWITAGAAND